MKKRRIKILGNNYFYSLIILQVNFSNLKLILVDINKT